METPRTLVAPDGVTLAYRLWRPGAPRPLVALVHGLASNATRWTEFAATTRLHDGWDLLAVDLRGFGRSLSRGPVGLEVWGDDLAAVLQAERAPGTVVVGHCLGADVALHFAARYPAAVRGLVVIEPTFPQALTGGLRTATRFRPLARAVAGAVRALNALGVHRGRLPRLDLVELDREARAAMAAGGTGAFPEERYGSVMEDLRWTPTAVYLASLVALTAPPPDLRTVDVPVLALLSRGGRFGDPAITARVLGALPRCDIRMLEARHWIPTECPGEMRESIDAWCEALAAAGR
jgi:pimeloyl-ACP methyl ester carboxylesterase